MTRSGHQEVVILYQADETISSEIPYSTFQQHLSGAPLEAHAASRVKAAFCVVANGLRLAGVVFFEFVVDEHGDVDPNFNLPLRYLVQNSGVGGELEHGLVRKASRGQCPVPWHSTNLWEPASSEALKDLQQRLYRNKLGIKPVLTGMEDYFEVDVHRSAESDENPIGLQEYDLDDDGSARAETQELIARLEEVLGQDGRMSMQDLVLMHSEQLSETRVQHRRELEEQQTGYLEQIKTYREEIHELKVALRQEQSRNRRLQQMLRGDP